MFMVLFVVGYAFSQRTVTGSVTDVNGEALIGANVLVKGSTTGTITDIDGSFSLQVPEDTQELSISYTGFQDQDINIFGINNVAISLSEGEMLDEIVVTGLGIKREKKALGYGVSTIASDEVQGRSEADVARILRGKATGVDITQTSGMAGTGTSVIIRGYSSITGTNQPLFVVDGVPFNIEGSSDRGFATGGSTSSSRFLDLDPNTIAEISILKGLSATVLYGEAGRNGVVLVTTKNGTAGADTDKGFEVSVSQNLSTTEVANLPEYQNTYGNGFSGSFGWFFSNWGPAFANTNPANYPGSYQGEENGQVIITHPLDQGQYNDDVPEFIGARYPYQPYESVENFFGQGLTSNTSISVSNNLGNGNSFSASYSYLSDEGFTLPLDAEPNSFLGDGGASNYLRKHNFGLGGATKLSNGIGIRGSFNYIESESRIPPAGPAFGGDGEGLFAAVLFTPRSVDLMNLPYQSPIDGSNIYYRRGGAIQNPLWTLHNTADYEDIKRFFGSITVDYQLTDKLGLMYRTGVDQYSESDLRETNKGGPRNPDGNRQVGQTLAKTADHVINLTYQDQLNEDMSFDVTVGANFRKESSEGTFTSSTNQFVYGLFTNNNFIDHIAFSNRFEENTIGAYTTATLGFRNFFYVNLQGRNDWTSTLEPENRSVFYPSASVSFIPTEAIPSLQNNNVLNYLKMRVGYGTSAGYPDPYQTRNTLNTTTNVFVPAGGNGLNINSVSSRLGNRNLAAEKHRELEFGLEARLLDNRIGIDLSLYNKISSDLIIDLDLDPSTGFTNTTVNAAELENNGIELGLNITPFRGDFGWDFTLNFTKNISEVNSIFEGVDQIQIEGFGGGLGNYAIPGEQYGVIQGTSFTKNDNGELLVASDGRYVPGSGIEIIGNPNPNYTANWINNFSYKGLSFGFQWQYIDGGDIFSSTIQSLLARGNTVDTDVNRFLPIVVPGVKSGDGTTPNDVQAYIGDVFFNAYFFANEGGIFDGTVVRLREVSLSYALPKKLLENTPFGSAGLTLAGENLFFRAPNFPAGTNFDPEVLSVGVGNGRGFDFRTAPTSKKMGLTLNLTF